MQGLAIVNKGIEDTAALEIKELIKASSEIRESCVIFSIKDFDDLAKLCYTAQSVSRILFLLDYFKIKNIEDIREKVERMNFDKFLNKNNAFVVRSERIGEHSFTSSEIEAKTGEFIIEKIKKGKSYTQKVDLNNPDIVVFIYVYNDDCYIGVDFAGRELDKRDYKIFSAPNSLKGTVAYALVRIAEYNKKEIILDPFCLSGEIPIEAAMFANNFPVNHFSKDKFAFNKFLKFDFGKLDKKIKKVRLKIMGFASLTNLKSCQKNAKIAGIEKSISITKIDVDWLDIKLKKSSIDKIISYPPQISIARNNEKEIEKIYKELFYQAEYILKGKGRVILLTRKDELLKKYAEEYKFRPINEKIIMQGKEEMKVLIWEK